MAVLQMQKIHICGAKNSRKQILEELQRSGTVQIEREGEEDDVFRRTDTRAERNSYEKCAQSAENALKILNQYVPEKTGLLDSLKGRKVISEEEYDRLADEREDSIQTAKAISAIERIILDCSSSKLKITAAIESMVPWMKLDLPMNFSGSRSTQAFIGSLPGEWNGELITSELEKVHPELSAYWVEILEASRDQTCLFAVCINHEADFLEDALRVNGFVRLSAQTAQTPEEFVEAQKQLLQEYEESGKNAIAQLKELECKREELKFAVDYYSMRAEKYGILGELLQSGHTFFLDGYIPECKAGALKEKLESKYPCDVRLEEIARGGEVPVLLKNNAFTGPTEGVVESFGLPNGREIDPTAIMAFFYYFFFGMMLSDAGYGLLMVIGCAVLLKKFPNMAKNMKKMFTMFFYCGISTTIWGILFGGFFGDVISVVSGTFFGRTVSMPALWFEPLNDPMRLLMFSFLFGLIHLFVGLGIKGYLFLKERKYLDFFSNVICWYALLLGLIFLLIPTEIFASMASISVVFPGWVSTLSIVMAIIGAAGILFLSKKHKNPGVRIALGAYELYGITSWLSDVLSYSRLLALGLATSVIASVINTMGSMMSGFGVLGFVLFWVIFLIGHALNMAINLLGAYVHTNRLQYVEFFGKFYEGGGKPFRPFSAETNKYFQFKEES